MRYPFATLRKNQALEPILLRGMAQLGVLDPRIEWRIIYLTSFLYLSKKHDTSQTINNIYICCIQTLHLSIDTCHATVLHWIMIVFDSSTVILLAKIEILELFISDFHSRVVIPERVRSEVSKENQEETPLILKLIADNKIEVLKARNINQIKKLMDDFNIGAGEAEALTLAIQEKASIIATDDKNAIRTSKILKIDFTTALAILIRAYKKRLIEKDEALIKLEKLQSIGRYSRAIIEDATRQIKGGV